MRAIIKVPGFWLRRILILNCGLKYKLNIMTLSCWTICDMDFLYVSSMTLFRTYPPLLIICQPHAFLLMLIFTPLQNFESVPFEKFHVSPLLTRPKINDSRRVIVNLSYPEGQLVSSNIESDSYAGYDFDLSYPTIDNIVDEIAKVGEDVLLYKLDISRAFHNLLIDPRDYGVMGLQWDHNYYIDVSVAFGYKHGSEQMQRLGDTIKLVMTSQSYAVSPILMISLAFRGLLTP